MRVTLYFLFFMLVLLQTGCRTVAPFPAVDFKQTDWKIQEGQAVWKPNHKAPEIAGEILAAQNSTGKTVVQFIKNPFPITIAQTTSNAWQIEFPPQNKTFSGRGKPPAKFGPLPTGWLQLANCLKGNSPPANWSFQKIDEMNWRLENKKTGESIEGFLNP
ncbi:MAG: hypothetical protein M3Y82_02815 [Verrucomicrobiota bacterium]|nr:hypothetical protein [Verrucomicrobiota bacterium]